MKPIKCENCEKFYDGDKYEICPHCKGEPVGKSRRDVTIKPHPITESRQEHEESDKHTEKKEYTKKEHDLKGKINRVFKKKQLPDEKQKIIISDDIEEKQSTEEITEKVDQPEQIHGDADNKLVEKELAKNKTEDISGDSNETEETKSKQQEEITDEVIEEQPVSLAEAIKQTESTSNDKTVAFYNFSNDVEPVVGWIVCVKGEYMGESFPLKSGRNNIGRSLSMDIALAKEKSVSREKHAAIVFEPHQKKTFIQGGESSGLTYVNDELVMMFRELSDYDTITLGESKFVFIHFVGDKFSWEDYT